MSVAAPGRVVIDDAPLTVSHVVAVARGAAIALGPTALERIRASRAVVDRLVSGDKLVYGLNTGLGHGRNERVPVDVLEAGQADVVRAHAGGLGPPLRVEIVRAAMAVRVAGIARGGSGASPAIAETYVALLNAGVHPVVPLVGSIGASDLMHMAAIALVAMGEGEAEVGGERMPGGQALARAGIAPVRLGPKDGLTVISANGVSIGHAALLVDRARVFADSVDLVVALSLEAARGNPSIVDPVVASAKPVPGQSLAASRIRRYLEGSRLSFADAAESVQDALSFRVAPQVHGAFREVLEFAARSVDTELVAMDDNPLVSIAEDRMISNGNFHPMLLALAVDALRPALAHVGQLSDRRTGQLWDRVAAETGAFSAEAFERLARYGSPLLRYSGAARAAELRTLAGPATLDVPTVDLGVEDHATNAPLAVRRTDEALDIAEDVLAVELLTAGAILGAQEETRARMSPRTRAALERVRSTLKDLGPGANGAAIHAATRGLLGGSLVLAATGSGDEPAGSA
jgi:histidine ammonia-lyase